MDRLCSTNFNKKIHNYCRKLPFHVVVSLGPSDTAQGSLCSEEVDFMCSLKFWNKHNFYTCVLLFLFNLDIQM